VKTPAKPESLSARGVSAVDLRRARAALARLDGLGLFDDAGAAMDLVADRLRAADPVTLAAVEAPMPKLRDPKNLLSEPFTLRVGAATLEALDGLANRLAADPGRSGGRPVNRQAAGRLALERGIRALQHELAGERPTDPSPVHRPDLPSAETVAAATATLEALAAFPHEALLQFVRLIKGAAGSGVPAGESTGLRSAGTHQSGPGTSKGRRGKE
jgi:hypothetical protein